MAESDKNSHIDEHRLGWVGRLMITDSEFHVLQPEGCPKDDGTFHFLVEGGEERHYNMIAPSMKLYKWRQDSKAARHTHGLVNYLPSPLVLVKSAGGGRRDEDTMVVCQSF